MDVEVDCEVFDSRGQLITTWSVNNGSYSEPQGFEIFGGQVVVEYEGDPLPSGSSSRHPHFRNRLIIRTFKAVLNGSTLYCGTGGKGGLLKLGIFPLLLQRKYNCHIRLYTQTNNKLTVLASIAVNRN